MGIVIRQSIKGTTVSYIGVILGVISILWIFPYCLSTVQIGLYRVLIDAATFFVIFTQLGTNSVSIKFFPYFKDPKKKHNGFLFYLLLVPFIGFVFFLVLFIFYKDYILAPFQDKSPLLINYYYYVIPLTFFLLYMVILESYAQSLLKIVVPKLIREIIIRSLLAVAVILFFFHLVDLSGFIWLIIILYGIALCLLIGYIKYLGQLYLQPDFKFLNPALFKQMRNFGVFMLLGSSGGILVAKIDTFMLSSLSGLNDTGIYTIAFFMGIVIEMPRRSISTISNPIVADALKNNNIQKVKELYHKTSLNQLIIGSLLFIGLWSNIDAIFSLIPNSEIFIQGKYVVLFIALAKLFDMAMGINAEIITNSKYYRWNIFLMPFLAVLAITTNYIFIPIYGITGAAIATAISILLYNVIRFIFVWLKLKIQPFSWRNIVVVIVGLLTYGIIVFIPHLDNIIIDIAVRSILITILFTLPIFALRVSEDLNNTLFKIAKLLK